MKYDHYVIDTPTKWEHSWNYRPLLHNHVFPLVFQNIGYARWLAGEMFSRTRSNHFVIEFVCAGNVVLVQEGKKSLIQKGEVYLLRKNVSHYYTTGPAGFVLKRFVQMGGTGIDYYLRLLGLWNRDYIRLQHSHPLKHLLRRATALIAHHPSHSDRQLAVQLSCLAYQTLLELGNAVQISPPPVIEQALTFMHENLHRSLSRQELCEYLGLSSPYFTRIFSQYMHCSPIAYFLQQKFNWSAQLLETTSFSIKEIAYKVGFDDPLYFSSQFKKHFGVSPRQYREADEVADEQECRKNRESGNISHWHSGTHKQRTF